MDERYLNYSHVPIVSPLKKSLRIEMYNDTYFSRDVVNMSDNKQNQPTNDIDSKAFSEHTAEVMLPAETLFQSSGNLMPPHETQAISRVLPSDHDSIQLSTDKLFFVKFTPERTM